MSLPYWVEYLLTTTRGSGHKIGNMVHQVGSEYYLPVVPAATEFYFRTSQLGFYASLYYKATFGYMVPGAFSLSLVTRGANAFNGILQDHHLEGGLDFFYCQSPPDVLTAYVTNISPVNQMFEMTSEYLRIESEEDFREVVRVLNLMRKQGISAPTIMR